MHYFRQHSFRSRGLRFVIPLGLIQRGRFSLSCRRLAGLRTSEGYGLNVDSSGKLNRQKAVRIIQSLKQGSNCLDGAGLFSAGRETLFHAAEEALEEIELSGGSWVRWLRGRYGQGKTHFFARLMEIAFARNWVTTYVQV